MKKLKPAVTLEQHAAQLVRIAEQCGQDYVRGTPGNTWEGVVYGYIISALRWNENYFRSGVLTFSAQLVVAEALKQRFGMSEEEFATTILGG